MTNTKLPIGGDRVDRILSHRLSTDRKLLLNSRKAKESFNEIRKYKYNNKKDIDNDPDNTFPLSEPVR
jgi:hypothetical protein